MPGTTPLPTRRSWLCAQPTPAATSSSPRESAATIGPLTCSPRGLRLIAWGLFRQKAGTRIRSASMNIDGCRGGSRPNLSATAVLSPTIPRRTCLFRACLCRPTLAAAQPTTTPVRLARSPRTATGGPGGRHWTRSAAAPSSMSPEATGSPIRLSGRVGHIVHHGGNGQDQDVVLARSNLDAIGVPDAKPSLGNLGDLRAVLLDRVFMTHDVAPKLQVRAIL